MIWSDPGLSGVLVGGCLCLLSLAWLALWVRVPMWGRRWRLARPEGDVPMRGPKVSICIPARNEEANIVPCLRAAGLQRWSELEIVLVDDQSSDDTATMAMRAVAGDPRVRIVHGTSPPPGWAGKPWACSRAASEAVGDILLFVDADVRLDPDATRALVAELEARQLSLLSVYGTLQLQGFWERVVTPAVHGLIRAGVDLDRVNDPGRPEAFANGQLIAVQRTAYEALDGHGAVRDYVLDDVRLAEAFKLHGAAVGLLVAPWVFQVRLQRTLGEIVSGYGKSLYEGMGRKPAVGLGAVLFVLVGVLMPFAALFLGLVARFGLDWTVPGPLLLGWLAMVCGLQFAVRYRVERRDGRSGGMTWTHPLANAVLVVILLRSILDMRASWKGRPFVDGRVQAKQPRA